jgi:membrane-associated phospholipid phosphatase
MRSPARNRTLRRYAVAGSVLALAGLAASASSTLIDLWFPDRPMPRDLLFEVLPFAEWPQHLTEIALFVSIGLIAYYGIALRRDAVPGIICMYGLIELLRAGIMLLTPLASAHGRGAYYGFIPIVQNGMFPSGHVASVTLGYLIVGSDAPRWLRQTLLTCLIVECVALLLSHGHYSIDIVGGLLLAYFVHREYTRGRAFNWIRRLVEE